MDEDECLSGLKNLQRDLVAFAEQRIPHLERLSAELDASTDDLRKLLERKRRNESSRKEIAPDASGAQRTVNLQGTEWEINEGFRQAAILVADELDLDEVEAVKLCIQASVVTEDNDSTLPLRAILRFQDQRLTLLQCLRLILSHSVNSDLEESPVTALLAEQVQKVFAGNGSTPDAPAYFRKCTDALTEVEAGLQKIRDHRQTMIMTGQSLQTAMAESLDLQRILLLQQHEALAATVSYIIQGHTLQSVDFRTLMSKIAVLEAPFEVVVHYIPLVIRAMSAFGSSDSAQPSDAHDLHSLFAEGHSQLQWKSPQLKAFSIASWLAEYGSRFIDTTSDPMLRVADRQKAEEQRSMLFMKCVDEQAFQFLLMACRHLKPELWYDPAKIGLVDYLLSDSTSTPGDMLPSSEYFADLVMEALQIFTDSFVSNTPDVVRRLKTEEDDKRRLQYSRIAREPEHYQPHLERFMVIMAYAYADDPAAGQDFLVDKEGNLYGFLRWASKRLPTPRVAAFCELLRSVASDAKTANLVHRFLLEETEMSSGKLRKVYNVGWSQIFSELETYANTLKDKPATLQSAGQDAALAVGDLIEAETGIMLEAYLRLASHVCRMSPDARNWLLREQTFHLAENMFQLASTGIDPRIQSSCFYMLSSLLTDKISEVNDGMWALLDNWIHAGGSAGAGQPRPSNAPKDVPLGKYYLQQFNRTPEIATAFTTLLTGLIAPANSQEDVAFGSLPFPENLGAATRHAGIDDYVDFVIGVAFKSSPEFARNGYSVEVIDVLNNACLDFLQVCLATFNENLVLIANTTNVTVDATIRSSSLATYIRLHPFARVMEWLFNDSVIDVLLTLANQSPESLLTKSSVAPSTQAVQKALHIMSLALRLQLTYLDTVRPLIKLGPSARSTPVGNSAWASFDDVIMGNLGVLVNVLALTASEHFDLSMAALELLQETTKSKKLNEASSGGRAGLPRAGDRLVAAVADISESVSVQLQADFELVEHDIADADDRPLKLSKANATLQFLNSSLTSHSTRPVLAHALLGFTCRGSSVSLPAIDVTTTLFHALAVYTANAPIAIGERAVPWLLDIKRGCFEILLKLATSPLTSSIIVPQLRAMDFLSAVSFTNLTVDVAPVWDTALVSDPELLFGPSADALREFIRLRELYFQYSALELRSATETRSYSVQEQAIAIMQGRLQTTDGETCAVPSVLRLSDVDELETASARDVVPNLFADVNVDVCLRADDDNTFVYDLEMAEELLMLQRKALLAARPTEDAGDVQQLDDEILAILASMRSQNNWRAIRTARVGALEAWTDLVALMITSDTMKRGESVTFALQVLQVVLPRFEQALATSLESAALLAKLTLTLVLATISTSTKQALQPQAAAEGKLLLAFNVCFKAVTDSGTDLALRDVCYRTCTVILSAMTPAIDGKSTASPQSKSLSHLVQAAGDRLVSVITEDAFSGRGPTRVSAVLLLDPLVALFQQNRTTTIITKALGKLNFVPVLIDTSIGSIASSIQEHGEEMATTLAYFHTAMSFLLRMCQSSEGTQLVVTSGFFSAVSDSRLFSTDPDIGLDIDNPVALRQFYRLLSAVLRVITAIVITRGSSNATSLQQARSFLQENRFSMQAVYKRTSAVQKTAGPPETEALEVADEFGRLIFVTGFLEEDEPAHQRLLTANGFS